MNDPVSAAPVLVTGASGFIATHIVEQLLAGGYAVRGTVRNPGNAKRYDYLTQLTGADRLELVAADLMTDGAFDSAVDSVEYAIHTASPYVLTERHIRRSHRVRKNQGLTTF